MMKKRKGSFLQRMAAVLLSVVLTAGMVSNAAPMAVLAEEADGQPESVSGNTAGTVEGGTESEEETETEPAEETNPEGQEPDGGAGQETQEPGGGTEQETPGTGTEEETETGTVSGNDVESDTAPEQQGVMMAAVPALQADNIASGNGWVLDAGGKLTIESDTGMSGWISNRSKYGRQVTSAEIRSGVTSIGKDAFFGCSDLEGRITLPDGVTSIGENAFTSCPKLTGITIPESVTSIGAGAFAGCDGLTSITIPGNVTSIGGSAFATCEGLTSITIPESVASMGENMFAGCSNLTHVKLPTNITGIGEYMFSNCGRLTGITIPETVTAIGEAAFYNCGSLQEITIPSAVIQIDDAVFDGCTSLEMITFLGNNPPTLGKYDVFGREGEGDPESCMGLPESRCAFYKNNEKGIHVPEGRAQTYKDAWKDWAAYIADDASSSEKTDFEKLIETMEVIMAALEDFTADNDTTAESIQRIIDAAVADAGITDAVVEVRDFQKTAATTEAEGKIQAAIYVRCGTRENTGSMEEKIDRLQPSHTHTLALTPAKPADCTTDGNKAYYTCSGCDKWFLDAAGTQEITDKGGVVIAAGHSYGAWVIDRQATETEKGEKHRECSVCGDVQTEIIPVTGGGSSGGGDDTGGSTGSGSNTGSGADGDGGENGNTDSGHIGNTGDTENGNIISQVVIKENVPATAFATPEDELAGLLLTEQEKQMTQGGTDIRIVLNVEDMSERVDEAEKALVESVLEDWRVGQYLDISLFKLIGEQRTQITETAGKIRITLAIPKSLRRTAGTAGADSTDPAEYADASGAAQQTFYAILRVHNGQIELLPDLDNHDDTITVETDRFSTYVLILLNKETDGAGGADTAGTDAQNGSASDGDNRAGENEAGTGTGSGDGAGEQAKDDEPKTGGFEPAVLYATISMIAGLTYLLLYFADRGRGMTEETKKELVSKLTAWAKQGRIWRRYLALAAVFMLLVYYHSIGKKTAVEWTEIYGKQG